MNAATTGISELSRGSQIQWEQLQRLSGEVVASTAHSHETQQRIERGQVGFRTRLHLQLLLLLLLVTLRCLLALFANQKRVIEEIARASLAQQQALHRSLVDVRESQSVIAQLVTDSESIQGLMQLTSTLVFRAAEQMLFAVVSLTVGPLLLPVSHAAIVLVCCFNMIFSFALPEL